MAEPDVWIAPESCSLDAFRACVERRTDTAAVPLAAEIVHNIPLYDGAWIRRLPRDDDRTRALMAEWNRVFATGPGIVAVRGGLADTGLVDEVSAVLDAIAAEEAKTSAGSGDHFAASGANTRIWNAHEKLCLAAPQLFARYNAGPVVPLASLAWLGPAYQITTQVNIVRPGGRAQTCHRDYHLGFMGQDQLAGYPRSAHTMSASLTLQGAIAHVDMPAVSGPTKLLPYSQTYAEGYVATLLPAFRDYFERHFVQLDLAKGDALFFNPAVFHAAGENRSEDIDRFANLLQVGSALGRSIEIVNRTTMSIKLYPVLREMQASGALTAQEIADVVAACAAGYPFPVDLDIDSPLTGMAPPSQQDLMRQALAEGWPAERLTAELQTQAALRLAN